MEEIQRYAVVPGGSSVEETCSYSGECCIKFGQYIQEEYLHQENLKVLHYNGLFPKESRTTSLWICTGRKLCGSAARGIQGIAA